MRNFVSLALLVCAAELAWALIKLQCMARSRGTIAGEQGMHWDSTNQEITLFSVGN